MNICKSICASLLLSAVSIGHGLAHRLPLVSTKGDINNVLTYGSKEDKVFPYYFPTISTAANPVYYYIQFQTGNWLLSAKGEKATCQTASLYNGNLDDMLWRVSETNGKYAFVSKSGKILYINNDYVNASKERSSKDTLFTMVESKNALKANISASGT